MAKIRCINAAIFKDSGGDCSNYGISHFKSEVLIPHKEGWIEVDEDNLPENFCNVVKGFQNHIYLKPIGLKKKWSMFGGCFAYSSDSRFQDYSEYPIPIHDRVEN